VFNPKQIHAYLRAGGAGNEIEQVGPFLATFTPGTKHPMLNYAIPEDDACPDHTEVGELIDLFRRRGLKPRLEYADAAAPRLEAILRDSEFEVEKRLPLMVCQIGEARSVTRPVGFDIGIAVSDEEHSEAMLVANDAYGEPAQPTAAAVAVRRRMAASGGAVALARHRATGEPAGSGLYPIPRASVTELAGIGTRDGFRRRGVALALSAALAKHAFNSGIELLWLTPENGSAERIYSRVGFTRTTWSMVHISMPAI
jgi:GNAT superfamily N-acetyltransferase